MNVYKLESMHHVCKDDYENGQGETVNSFILSEEIKASTPKEALIKYFEFLGCEISPQNIEEIISNSEDDIYHWSKLVDRDNIYATKNDIEQWKKGLIDLYCDYFSIAIYELKKVGINSQYFLP
jgi:hypothetical protein